MKNLLLLIFFACSLFSYSQELSVVAKELQKSQSQFYNTIKTRAIKEWKDDHSMVLYEINKQSDAFHNIGMLLKENKNSKEVMDIFKKSVYEWSNIKEGEVTNPLFNSTVDWSMVYYEMDKQMKSKNAY